MTPTRTIGLSAFLFAVLAIFSLGQVASADDGPFGPIHVAANRSQYNGRGCPVQVIYTASINFVSPHPQGFVFNYHWQRSDGATTPVRVVRPGANQGSMVIHETWRLGATGHSYDAAMTLFINSGNTHLSQGSPVVRIICR